MERFTFIQGDDGFNKIRIVYKALRETFCQFKSVISFKNYYKQIYTTKCHFFGEK